MPLVSFSAGQVISSANVNANFGLCVLTDTSRTITVTHTFSASQTFSAGIALTGTLTMATALSKIVPGATSFAVRNNADNQDNLLVSDAGAVTVRAGLTATSLTGTGVISTTAVNGAFSASGASTTARFLVLSNTSGTTIIGTEGSVPNTIITGTSAYDTALRGLAGIAFSANDGTTMHLRLSSTGALSFGTAASKIIPGATSFAVRDTADARNNILVTDAGKLTVFDAIQGARYNDVNGLQVVSVRDTGWTAMTGTPDESTSYATGSVTLPQLAGRVMALQTALTNHGLIGT